jgi:hypothetical protein
MVSARLSARFGSVCPVQDVLVGFGLVRRWWAASFSALDGHEFMMCGQLP